MEKIDLDLADIFEYIKSSRPIKEGEAVFNAGHITLCGLKDSNSAEFSEIVGFCLQTSNLTGPPHKIEINLNEDVKLWKAKCSCKAGLGEKCKHIAAILIYINRNGQLEKLSCTDLEQLWGKSGPKQSTKKDAVEYSSALKMIDYCHPVVKKVKLIPESNMDEINKKNSEILQQVLQNSETGFYKMVEGRKVVADNDLSNFHAFDFIKNLITQPNTILEEISASTAAMETDFYREKIKNADPKMIYENTLGQNNTAWIEARKYRITGSNCYSLSTYSYNKNPNWLKKITDVFSPSFRGNAATDYGRKEEENARITYEKISGQEVKQCGYIINKMVPWLGFSPDGIAKNNFLIEIKFPVAGQTKTAEDILPELKYLQHDNEEFVLKRNHAYYGQVQLGMLLLNLEYTDFIIYSSFDKSMHVISVKYDKEFCKKMLLDLKNVYFNQILKYVE